MEIEDFTSAIAVVQSRFFILSWMTNSLPDHPILNRWIDSQDSYTMSLDDYEELAVVLLQACREAYKTTAAIAEVHRK